MHWRKIALFLAFCSWALVSSAQQTTVFTEANETYKEGLTLFEKGLYGAAQRTFQEVINMLRPLNESESKLLRTQATFYYARSAIRQGLPDGEKLMLDFIRNNAPDPVSNQALIELANFYFNDKNYEKAIEYYSQVPSTNLTREQQSETRFKLGYAYFTQQQFGPAKNNFNQIKDIQNEYYYPTNYYLGLVHFFEGNYDAAIKSFQVVERSNSRRYESHIPYYLAQIYFAQGRYDELLTYSIPKLNAGNIQNVKEIYQLVGQAYFEKGQYENALPYLEYYAQGSSKMREEEFYQLGYVQMKTGNQAGAIKNFEELTAIDSKLGQNALYNLGRLYLETGQGTSARNAFGAASRMNYDAEIQEEALFNYAKLSYELKFDQDAITALQSIQPSSKYYTNAQTLMSQIFLNTRNYERALAILESMPNLTPDLREAYQTVAYYRGVQLYQQKDYARAAQLFNKSLEMPVDASIKAMAIFWQGDMAYRDQQYDRSIQLMNQFLTLARTVQKLPDESSVYTANYTQGYNYLKQENYTGALGYFQQAIEGIKRNEPFIQSQTVENQVLGDAIIRAGDALFKRNQYQQAVQYYDEAIQKRYSGFIYALYQKAIIEGLRGNVTDKILALERIIQDYPKSEFTDDALFQLAVTYQELGQLSKAIAPLEQLIRNFGAQSDLVTQSLIRLGLISYNQGNLQQAIGYYKQVFSNNPEPAEAAAALRALEEIYISDLGDPDSYFAFLRTVPGYNVDNIAQDSISFRAAEVQFENANYQRAIESYTNYIARFSNGINIILAHYRRGDAYAALKQYSNALLDYEFVVNKGPSKYYAKALEKAAIIAYNSEQDFRRAYELYNKLEAAAETADLRFDAQLGALRSAYRAGMTAEVNRLSNEVSNNRNASQAQIGAANFYRGKLAYDQKDYDNALSAFSTVIRLVDNELAAEARYLTANIYYLRRDLDRAQEITINANTESSSYPYWVAKSIILLSDVFKDKGDLFNARAALEALLDNYKDDQQIVSEAQTKLQALNRQIESSSRVERGNTGGVMEFQDEGSIPRRN